MSNDTHEKKWTSSIKDGIAILTFVFTLVGFGIGYGKLTQRVEVVESRVFQVEDILNTKLESLIGSVANQNIRIAVLTEKIDQLTTEIHK